jgi:hypothetical protein
MSCSELVINLRILLAQTDYFRARITSKPRKNALQNKVNSTGFLLLVLSDQVFPKIYTLVL